ncbi:MAG: hypothetical protein H0T48_10230 [Gemmatimonadaceae bacterium]|nr:hypothetical protein [Gemmatimonadaceae bacterium]
MPAPNKPAEIIKIAGDDQRARPGDRLQPIVVAVRDLSGKPVSGAQVTFAVTAGDGFFGTIEVGPDGTPWVGRWKSPVSQVANGNGEATVLWFLGRHGENTLLATVEGEGKPLEVTFRATSMSSGYPGGSFALTSTGTSMKLYDGFAGGPYNCVINSGLLVLSPDGSFEGKGHFDCGPEPWGAFSFDVIETGFYAVSDSTIVLHYLKSNDTAGFFTLRDVHGVVSDGTIGFSYYGVEWRYARFD